MLFNDSPPLYIQLGTIISPLSIGSPFSVGGGAYCSRQSKQQKTLNPNQNHL